MANTSLFNAVLGRNVKVVELLLNLGADAKLKNEWNELAVDYARNISASSEIVMLLKRGGPEKRERY